MGSRDPVIVGIGWSDYPVAPELDAMEHHAMALRRALADSGLRKSEIDGYMCAGTGFRPNVDDAPNMAEYLRIDHRWLDGTMVGGGTFEFFVQHASAAIEAGMCDVIAVTYGSDMLSRMGRVLGTSTMSSGSRRVAGPSQFECSWGNVLAGAYAMAARRHMHEYGTTPEQLADIAVGVREYAGLNPSAQYRDPITVEDVLSSRMIADPLHKLDCCVISDGGGAFIMTTRERARDLSRPPVFVLGAAGAQTHWTISQMPDFTTTAAARCGPEAFGRAGVRPEEVDTVQCYDSFTITVLMLLEDMGFCPKGEGGAFVETGALRRGGRQPLNTDGGGLSACHPGMRGVFLINEAVRQLRGEGGDAQVPGAQIAVACGSGGSLSCIGTVVLGGEGRS
ncbi:MAG TPA: acetyl-CoA acetyltransferase [Acidimicrobiales bacterium]|jgi:acetyl-CoA acetyltransferase|nr:acetyl-CoA acetyltransferase [Acidimicrobiales bacterium]